MNIIIDSKQFKLQPTHSSYIQKKISPLSRLDASIYQIRVELDADKKEREGKKFRIEAWIEGRSHVKAGAQGKDLYSTVDEVIPKLKRQITKYKEQRLNHK